MRAVVAVTLVLALTVGCSAMMELDGTLYFLAYSTGNLSLSHVDPFSGTTVRDVLLNVQWNTLGPSSCIDTKRNELYFPFVRPVLVVTLQHRRNVRDPHSPCQSQDKGVRIRCVPDIYVVFLTYKAVKQTAAPLPIVNVFSTCVVVATPTHIQRSVILEYVETKDVVLVGAQNMYGTPGPSIVSTHPT